VADWMTHWHRPPPGARSRWFRTEAGKWEYPHIVDRGKPGLIAVLADGRRFVNEADGNYQFTTGMITAVPRGEEVCAWLICDHAFQRRYPFGMSKPFPVPAWPYLRSGYLKKGKALADLASRCGIDPVRLNAT
jgi:hypothetical protein